MIIRALVLYLSLLGCDGDPPSPPKDVEEQVDKLDRDVDEMTKDVEELIQRKREENERRLQGKGEQEKPKEPQR